MNDTHSAHLGRQFDYVIKVCHDAAAKCTVFPGAGTKLHWPFEDAADAIGSEEDVRMVFRRVGDHIGIKTKNWMGKNGVPMVHRPNRNSGALSPLPQTAWP